MRLVGELSGKGARDAKRNRRNLVVAHVISGLMFGGGQRVALDLISRFGSAADIDGRLVLLGDRGHFSGTSLPAVVPYDGRYDRTSTVARSAMSLRRIVRDTEVRIVHSHGWDADFITSLSIYGMRCAHLIHLHVWPDWLQSSKLKHRIRRALSRWMIRRPGTATVAVSDAVRQRWVEAGGLDPDAVSVIRNGVDLKRFSPTMRPHSPRPAIGAAARLSPMKGLGYLIEAMAALRAWGVDGELRIAGSGSYRADLERDVARLGLEDRVTFLGQVVDMPEFYRSLDLFVLPSLSEGLPLTVLEAMACGVAVVATDVGGVSEVIDDQRDGILVEASNLEALARAIADLLRDDAKRASMGQRGRDRVEREFSLESVSRQFVERYRKLVLPVTSR